MENEIHQVLRSVSNGEEPKHFGWFEPDEDGRAINREEFEQYLPGLIIQLEKGGDEHGPFTPFNLLKSIMPDEPGIDLVNALLREAVKEDREQIDILKLLALVKLPEGIDIQPLKDLVADENDYLASFAIKAFKAVQTEEAEAFLLERLRTGTWRSLYSFIPDYCETIEEIGSIHSIPVLMAVRLDYPVERFGSNFDAAIAKICQREMFEDELKISLKDPSYWKPKWQGSPQDFAGFITLMSFVAVHESLNDPTLIDKVAEIYMKEMEVDISPYQSFQALRLCSPVDDYMLSKRDHLKGAINEMSLFSMLGETGIMPSELTMAKDLYLDLMTDYFMTRLRRHVTFAEKPADDDAQDE